MSLEDRVKVLEDLIQRINQAFIAAPTQQPQQPKPTASSNPDEVCPECGGKKKPDFKQCFKCYSKAHPK